MRRGCPLAPLRSRVGAPSPTRGGREADPCPQPTFVLSPKRHSLVVDLHADCVIGLEEPSDLGGNWRRPKPDPWAGPGPEQGGRGGLGPEPQDEVGGPDGEVAPPTALGHGMGRAESARFSDDLI